MYTENIILWPERTDLVDAETKLEKHTGDGLELIRKHEGDLDQSIRYTNSSGTSFENRLSDLLHHVIIHGQHHRAQIAKILRRVEITPPKTDFFLPSPGRMKSNPGFVPPFLSSFRRINNRVTR